MKKKSILILYTPDNWTRPKANQTAGLNNANITWHKVLKKRNYELLKASIAWYKGGKFTKYRRHLDDGSWEDVKKSVTPTHIHDKTYSINPHTAELLHESRIIKAEINKKIPFVNLLEFSRLLESKLHQAAIFQEFMPRTRVWQKGDVIKNPRRSNIVLKNMYGAGGDQVWIENKKRIVVPELRIQQDFIKATKNGELKDIRIAFIGDRPIYAYYRIAAKGNLYTNVHQGAAMQFEKLSRFKPLLAHSKKVLAPLRVFPKRVLSLDFLVEARTNKPYLVEANSMPGFENFPQDVNERYFTYLTKHFLDE